MPVVLLYRPRPPAGSREKQSGQVSRIAAAGYIRKPSDLARRPGKGLDVFAEGRIAGIRQVRKHELVGIAIRRRVQRIPQRLVRHHIDGSENHQVVRLEQPAYAVDGLLVLPQVQVVLHPGVVQRDDCRTDTPPAVRHDQPRESGFDLPDAGPAVLAVQRRHVGHDQFLTSSHNSPPGGWKGGPPALPLVVYG